MLENTFVHVPGIGRATEKALWRSGVCTWDDVLSAAPGMPTRTRTLLSGAVPLSKQALFAGDLRHFDRLRRLGETWRIFEALRDRCVYLDIETTGLSPIINSVTLVGLYDGSSYEVYVAGHNLQELPKAIKRYSMLVTFNGAQFDLPFLKAAFPTMNLPRTHIDLRWLTRRLGYAGGLKKVEQQYGIRRAATVRDLTGYDATLLWIRYERGDQAALEKLIEYNKQDVVSLKTLMERSYAALAAQTPFGKRSVVKNARDTALPPTSNAVRSRASAPATQGAILDRLLAKAASKGRGTRVVGIDLTGSSRRASGWALLDGSSVETALISTDQDLLRRTIDAKPHLVSIDSPLSLPGGVKSPTDVTLGGLPIYRSCELALKRMGIPVFWCLLPSMQSLTLRGMRLARALRRAGVWVIESYPGAAQDVLLIPRKGASTVELARGLEAAGIIGRFARTKVSHDELDAITSALVGTFYQADEHIALGNACEDYLIVPRSPKINYAAVNEILRGLDLDLIAGVTTAPQVA